jgi:iron(III) transport system permease protein
MKRTSLVVWLVAVIGIAILPWHMSQSGFSISGLFGLAQSDVNAASALWQALAHKRWWFLPLIAGLGISGFGVFFAKSAAAKGRLLLVGAGIGLAGLVLQGVGIGLRGWNFG